MYAQTAIKFSQALQVFGSLRLITSKFQIDFLFALCYSIVVNIEIKETHFCLSDLGIATKLTNSWESEFPRTPQNVLLILKFTINILIPFLFE